MFPNIHQALIGGFTNYKHERYLGLSFKVMKKSIETTTNLGTCGLYPLYLHVLRLSRLAFNFLVSNVD